MQRIKFSRSQTSKRPGEAKQKNAANQQKMACSGTFGTPGWVRTSGLSLRRRPLYPTELRGLIQKIFSFRVQPDSNELPLRRRTLYPAELRAHTTPGISVNEYARCVVPVVGLEPTRCCHQRILSPHRLPFRHTGMCYSCYIIPYFSPARKSFFLRHAFRRVFAQKAPRLSGGAPAVLRVSS